MLSIIIPTLNEEKNIRGLLSAIKKGGFDDYEVVLADASSEDKTVEIARKYGCIIAKGGLPAKGRNSGARIAKGDILFFVDADLQFEPENFIKEAMDDFISNGLSVASFPVLPQKNSFIMNPLTVNLFYNFPQLALKKVFPVGAMGIMVKKEVFDKVGGFDESVNLSEDHYFVQQAQKFGEFGIISKVKVYMPLRRFERDGYFTTFFKYLLCALNMWIFGKPSRRIKYDFGHYDKK